MISNYCNICNYETPSYQDNEYGSVNGNTSRFLNTTYKLWKCPKCSTVHSLNEVDFKDIYKDYPLNLNRNLDLFSRTSLKNLLNRCKENIPSKNIKILDYGCGNGVFIDLLKQLGYTNVFGFDPYINRFSNLEEKDFDLVILNDVIEHVEDPSKLIDKAIALLKPNGILYVGTADSDGIVSMKDLENHRMRLHQPFHRKIINQKTLLSLGNQKGLVLLKSFKRSYMDTLIPFCNYRFLDEYNKALNYNMDLALNPKSSSIVFKKPWLLFYAFFGYFIPSAIEPAVSWKVKL